MPVPSPAAHIQSATHSAHSPSLFPPSLSSRITSLLSIRSFAAWRDFYFALSLPRHRPRSKKRRVRKFSYGIPARVVAVGAALVPTLSALRSLAPIHCFLPTRNLWCRIGVRSCVAAPIIVTFSLSFPRSFPRYLGFNWPRLPHFIFVARNF